MVTKTKVKNDRKDNRNGRPTGYVSSLVKNQVFIIDDNKRRILDKEFKDIDENNDGILDKKEIENFLKKKLLHHETMEDENDEDINRHIEHERKLFK